MTVHCMAGQYRHKSTAHHATTRRVLPPRHVQYCTVRPDSSAMRYRAAQLQRFDPWIVDFYIGKCMHFGAAAHPLACFQSIVCCGWPPQPFEMILFQGHSMRHRLHYVYRLAFSRVAWHSGGGVPSRDISARSLRTMTCEEKHRSDRRQSEGTTFSPRNWHQRSAPNTGFQR